MADSSTPTPILTPDEIASARRPFNEPRFDALLDSHEALRDAVAVLTEERDKWRNRLDCFVSPSKRPLHDALDSAEARVAVLEAGLRDAIELGERITRSWQEELGCNKDDLDVEHGEWFRLRALLGGVPATKEEQT